MRPHIHSEQQLRLVQHAGSCVYDFCELSIHLAVGVLLPAFSEPKVREHEEVPKDLCLHHNEVGIPQQLFESPKQF